MLRLAVRAMNDRMGLDGLLPKMLVFGIVPSLPVTTRPLTQHTERKPVMALEGAEMATFTAKLRIAQVIRLKLSPAAKFIFEPGDENCVFLEEEHKWCRSVTITRTTGRRLTVTNGIKTTKFGISQMVPSKAFLHGRGFRPPEIYPRIFFWDILDCAKGNFRPQGKFGQLFEVDDY